jgi:acyl-CoA reductase-like NAD-dependent aldehyde dehydrogenase
MATCPAGGAADVDRAVQAAKGAFYAGLKSTTAQERGRVLFRLAERVRSRRAELAELETRNAGMPIVEAVALANAADYGLGAAVWTRDIFKAFRVVRELEAGGVWVNHMQPTMVEAPWGGYKASGFGREPGRWGVEEYLETKQVFINLDERPIGWYA